jgi:acyl carrier protein
MEPVNLPAEADLRKETKAMIESTRDIARQLKTILVKDLGLSLKEEEIADDAPLLEGGLALDSVVIAELIARIEDQFGIRFEDQNLRLELFETLTTLAEFVSSNQAARKTA